MPQGRSALTVPSLAMPAYSAEQLAELVPLLEYADSVELKLSVPAEASAQPSAV
jgi:hypothetical protein